MCCQVTVLVTSWKEADKYGCSIDMMSYPFEYPIIHQIQDQI